MQINRTTLSYKPFRSKDYLTQMEFIQAKQNTKKTSVLFTLFSKEHAFDNSLYIEWKLFYFYSNHCINNHFNESYYLWEDDWYQTWSASNKTKYTVESPILTFSCSKYYKHWFNKLVEKTHILFKNGDCMWTKSCFFFDRFIVFKYLLIP